MTRSILSASCSIPVHVEINIVCNQKVLEDVGYPNILKEKTIEKRFNGFVWGMMVVALVCSGVEAAGNMGMGVVMGSTSYMQIVQYIVM